MPLARLKPAIARAAVFSSGDCANLSCARHVPQRAKSIV
jgi:hypothetical protein